MYEPIILTERTRFKPRYRRINYSLLLPGKRRRNHTERRKFYRINAARKTRVFRKV